MNLSSSLTGMKIARMSIQSSATIATAAVAAASAPIAGAAAMSMTLATPTTSSTNGGLQQPYQDVVSSVATTTSNPLHPPQPSTSTPAFRWCRTAFIKKEQTVSIDNNGIQIEKISSHNSSEDSERSSWSKVIVEPRNNHEQEQGKMEEEHDENEHRLNVKSLDITQSSDWMEYIEHVENRFHDEGGAGAYDTMRCDIALKPNKDGIAYLHPSSVYIWGETFHLNRLQNSYLTLINLNNNGTNASSMNTTSATTASTSSAKTSNSSSSGDSIAMRQEGQLLKSTEIALKKSKFIIHQLLEEALVSLPPIKKVQQEKNDELIYLLRLTLLWSKSRPTSYSADGHQGMLIRREKNLNIYDGDDNNMIIVRGHACCDCKALMLRVPPKPIVVTIAAHLSAENLNKQGHRRAKSMSQAEIEQTEDASIDQSLPTRLSNPQAKIASWCRLRRQMERPETYKPPGVSEVLMVRDYLGGNNDEDVEKQKMHQKQRSMNLEVLEGLSSNCFVIYNDGTLRTPSDVVLHGYVRQLVLRHVEECGLTWDPSKPILLHDAPQKWKEAFITSSSRLILPISRILIPNNQNNNDRPDKLSPGFTELWRDPATVNTPSADGVGDNKIPKWQELLNLMLRD